MASQIKIISSMATQQLLADLIVQYKGVSADAVSAESVGGVAAAKRVRADEAFDVVVLASNVIDDLMAEGKIVAASRVDLVRSGVAIAVKAGSVKFDIGSEEAVKCAVLAARTVGYSTGPSGVYLAKLFERWGIADQIKNRIVQAPPGVPVGGLVAKGEVELGFQQFSELIHLEGIEVLGALPPDIQIMTIFSAGIAANSQQRDAVKALLDFMASPAATQAKIDNGMEAA